MKGATKVLKSSSTVIKVGLVVIVGPEIAMRSVETLEFEIRRLDELAKLEKFRI